MAIKHVMDEVSPMTKARSQLAIRTIKPIRRVGRPSAANAGEVDARLLEAATHLFLTLGFEGTSCDQIAALAGAGKGSLYARYANKEELFAAVVRRAVERTLRPAADIPAELPLTERLHTVGLEILHHALQPDALAMMRLVIATATRFPELAQLADKIGWQGGVERVAEVISSRTLEIPDALTRARPAAALFISLTFAPQQMRALLGDSQSFLQASAPARVDDAIAMLAKGGWLEGWK